MLDTQAISAKATADANAKTQAFMKDDSLARAKGSTPEQIEARKRVARLFCELHFPKDNAAAIEARLAPVDYTQTVTTTNGRLVNMETPKSVGFMGMGRKPAYFVSAAFPPKKPDDPIYCLEYFPLKK
jgi:hypothetical protein